MIYRRIKSLSQDKFFKDNAVFFIGSMIVAVFSYLYHPVMSRMMSVEDFGQVQALISLTYLTGIFLTIFGTIAVNIVSNHKDSSADDHIKLLSQLHKLALWVIGSFAIGIVILSPYLMRILQFDSAISFFPLAIILLVGIPFAFYSSYLKGTKQFEAISIAGIITSAGKLLFAILFVSLGMQVFGAVSALALATFVALLYALHKTRGVFRLSLKEKVSFTPALKKELSYGVLVLFSLGYITFLYTSDVLFVKYFFDPETAGLYSGIATIARIIFFVTASVAGVLLPTIKINANKKENIAILKKAFGIIVLMGVIALVIFFLFPSGIISLLIGEKYLPLATLLPLAGTYIFIASVANVFYSYFLALRDRRLITISSVGFIATVAMVAINHNSLQAIITDYILGASLTIVLLGMAISKSKVHKAHKV